MENIALIIIAAILVEALVEYGQTIAAEPILIATLVVGVVISFIFGVTLFQSLGYAIHPVADTVLSGVIISRGSNYVYDLIGRFTNQ